MKKLLHAEMWDKMQYLFRNYYDRMMHCTLFYDGIIDKENFKKALKFQIDNVPVLHSRYHNNFIKPYWVVQDYTIDDVITIKQSKNLEFDVNKFLTQQINIKNNVQIQVALFECEGKTALCMVSNHMCMDGGDFKYFLSTLCKNYTKLCLNNQNIEIKHGSRSYEVVYSGLSDEDKKIAAKLFKNVSQTKDKHKFPLTAKSPDDINRIVKHILPKEKFEVMRLAGKAKGHTVNDIMLACYFQSLFELAGYEKDATVTIPCMIDLRRHMKDGGAESGLTNHRVYDLHNSRHRRNCCRNIVEG
ncbi:MAG: condensation domain-containing protein [Clostridia bacterium]